ncbi:MAG TPA: thiamine-phosphate synthase family protein [Candidatus Thermoplasmatota archaeon]|nr:thiamine-phosphate synthase family protein [Candidatus Thermoplasmatota archaeon]
MRFAEEVVAAHFVPTWRGLLARDLAARGLNQTEIAQLMGVTQSAVSKHLAGRLGADERLSRDPRVVAAAQRVAKGLAERAMSPFEALHEAEALVRELETRGPICLIHEEEMPALAGLGCDICVRVAAGSALVPAQAALADLRAALRILESTPALARLLPRVGTNVARAVPGARDVADVAAVPGQLFEMRGAVKVPAAPEMGVSRHVAEVLLAAMRADPTRLACVNLAPRPALLAAAARAGLRVEEVDPGIERAPASVRFPRGVPDLFHHGGAFGVEPQAYLVGPDASQLALRVRALAEAAREADAPGPA